MSVAYANPDFYSPEDRGLRRYLGYSVFLHVALAAIVVSSIVFHFTGDQWSGLGGNAGNETRVNLVASTGLPMPKPPEITDSKTFDPADTLYKEVPEPKKPPEPPKPETKIPEFKKEKRLPPSPKSRTFEEKTPPPENAVPGRGGRPDIPTGYADTPGSSSSGVAIVGQGGGDFATRYGWYIQAVKRRVDPNWDRMSIDAAVRFSTILHCAVSFSINRDGSIKNVRITEPSGNPSWDNAGLRAIYNSNPLPALPSDFQGTEVAVTWDFPERHSR